MPTPKIPQLTPAQIKEAAGSLDMGLHLYIHRETGEFLELPDEYRRELEPELWEETVQILRKSGDDYLHLEPPSPRESYFWLRDFAETHTKGRFQDRLLDTLAHSKPFGRFKDALRGPGAPAGTLEAWQRYSTQRYIEYVEHELQQVDNRQSFAWFDEEE